MENLVYFSWKERLEVAVRLDLVFYPYFMYCKHICSSFLLFFLVKH